MSNVIADNSMSVDGYVTGRGANAEHGLGIGGEGIHAGLLARSLEQAQRKGESQWAGS